MSISEPTDSTPLMKQYGTLKEQAGDALLLFRMGDFYELFGQDAVEASRILDITLTSRDKNKPNPLPMAGVPHHSVQGYIQRLLKAGHKVAIGDQMEDPVAAKGIVRREITRVLTPAVQFETEGEASFLATVLREGESTRGEPRYFVAALDPSTGESRTGGPLSPEELRSELSRLPIRHFLLPEHRGSEVLEPALEPIRARAGTLLEPLPENFLRAETAEETLKRHYGVASLGALVPEPEAAHALGVLVHYVARSQRIERLPHLRPPQPLRRPSALTLGPGAPEHLDLFPGPGGEPSLFGLINRSRTAVGARLLRRWLAEPLADPAAISGRQAGVRELSADPEAAEELAAVLSEVYDLERILGRVGTRLASPRDTLALGRSLAVLPRIAAKLEGRAAGVLRALASAITEARPRLEPLSQRILRTQVEEAPLVARGGGIFRTGTDPALDRLLELTGNGERGLVELEARERRETGIASLKIRYNRVFGYSIEVTKSNLGAVPQRYQRRQSMANAERFFTEELKRFEDELLTASSRREALELELFDRLIADVEREADPILAVASALGELDGLVALSRLASEPGWTFPEIDYGLTLEIRDGRHPVVDQAAGPSGSFVPNDTCLSPETRMALVITGPNMGGKSTIMRQVALIAILGQIGAPVPARSARWGAFSAIHTRIGAHDAIALGRSTFMVEMSELAHILHHADERSLIVLDEIGRGTSTFDGMSVAWSALEWICGRIGARTLFATHYHELTQLAGRLPRLANAHMAVEGARLAGQGPLRFLYKLREGPANESFGIQVAELAGIPGPVVRRAWEVLESLEGSRHGSAAEGGAEAAPGLFSAAQAGGRQLGLFAPPPPPEPARATATPDPALLDLRGMDINAMTPIQALSFLAELQKRVAGENASPPLRPRPPGSA